MSLWKKKIGQTKNVILLLKNGFRPPCDRGGGLYQCINFLNEFRRTYDDHSQKSPSGQSWWFLLRFVRLFLWEEEDFQPWSTYIMFQSIIMQRGGAIVAELPVEFEPSAIAFSTAHNQLAVGEAGGHLIRIYSTQVPEIERKRKYGNFQRFQTLYFILLIINAL